MRATVLFFRRGAVPIILLVLSLLPGMAKADASENNFFKYEGHDLRHLVLLWGFCPPHRGDWYANRLMAFPIERILSPNSMGNLTPAQIRLLYFHNFDDHQGQSDPMAYSIIRNGTIVTPGDTLQAGDVLVLKTPEIRRDDGWVPSYSLFFNLSSEEKSVAPQANYGAVPASDLPQALSMAKDSDTTGFIDWSPEIDLSWPALMIQATGACSGQWHLWYEWSVACNMYSGWPRNVLEHLSTMNLGDNPQYPDIYLDYYEATGDQKAREIAKLGLKAILGYEIPSAPGTWPFGVFGWKNRVWNANEPIQGTTLDKAHGGPSPYMWCSIAKAQRCFKDDPDFERELTKAYDGCHAFFLRNMGYNLRFLNDTGICLEALAAHYAATQSPADKSELAKTAAAVLARHRDGIAYYGSELPKYTMGMAAAYKALGDPAYLNEARDFALKVACPCLWRNRQFFDRDPSGDNRNPDVVSGHKEGEQFVRLYDATQDPFFLAMAGFVWGSYEGDAWDGQGLFHKWSGGPSAEGNFLFFHIYVSCLKDPPLYKIMQTFRGSVPVMSNWKKWPLKVTSGNVSIEIEQNDTYQFSTALMDPAAHLLMVGEGNGGGLYPAGATIEIAPGIPAVGKTFDKWVVRFGGPALGINPGAAQTTVTMPAEPAGIVATFKRAPSQLKIIGTNGAEAPDSTKEKAFDGNPHTYFGGPHPSGDWVGLDLGASKRVTKIRYASRMGLEDRMPQGKFQGSDDPNFTQGAVDLFTITRRPADGGRMNEATITNPRGFRYVRYLGPPNSHSDVGELEFFVEDPKAGSP